MKCDLKSWGGKEVDCGMTPYGDCANCQTAWNYLNLFGPGSFSSKLSSMTTERVGKDLVATVMFNDGDPTVYKYAIADGKYIHPTS